MRNIKNKHPCPENFERYRVLRNKCVKAKLKSQREYFAERCDGGPKNQHFWPTIKPFINSKCHVQENIILREKDDIVNDAKSVAKIFNEYFTGIASDIGFNDPIPDDYGKDEAKSVAKIFNEYFTGIASDIGFNDPIPDDYGKDEV